MVCVGRDAIVTYIHTAHVTAHIAMIVGHVGVIHVGVVHFGVMVTHTHVNVKIAAHDAGS